MDTRSRPPGCGAGSLGRPLRDCRRMRACASCRALSPVDIKSPARPPARRRDWCCSGSSSSPSHRAHRMLQGSFPSQNLRRFAEVQGETGKFSVREYTNTHTHTHTHTHTYTHKHTCRWRTASKYSISRAAVHAYVRACTHQCRHDPILLVGTVAAL